MYFAFASDMAEKYGVNEAIFLHNLAYWIEHNRCNDRGFADGRYWSYNSTAAFAERFPFWSRKQVERIIASCREQGAVVTAQMAKKPMDRTLSYALDGDALAYYFGADSHFPESGNASPELGKSISRNREIFNEQIVTQIIPPISPTGDKVVGTEKTDGADKPFPATKPDPWYDYAAGDTLLLSALRDFEVMRNKRKKPMTERSRTVLAGKLDKLSGGDSKAKVALLEQSIVHCWDSVYPLKGEDAPRPGTETRRRETKEL